MSIYKITVVIYLLISISLILPAYTKGKQTYPKRAHIYLNSPLDSYDVEILSKWDVVILHMLAQNNSVDKIRQMKKKNPDLIVLAYVPSEEYPITNYKKWDWDTQNGLYHKLLRGITDDMWLLSGDKRHVKFWYENWMLNVTNYSATGQRWNEYLSDFVAKEILSNTLWDGIFYDNTFKTVSWINGGQIDSDRDGKDDSKASLDNNWEQGMKTLFDLTRKKAGRSIVLVGNGDHGYYDDINGLYIENFLMGDKNWSERMDKYKKSATGTVQPNIAIVGHTSPKQINGQQDYQEMRYGLASALMDDGYYGFDAGSYGHAEKWWYDEYNINLGQALGDAQSLDNKEEYELGVWKRDFQNGVAVVNPTGQTQDVELGAEYEKIKGNQDPIMNDGMVVSRLSLSSKDGAIMMNSLQGTGQSQTIDDLPFSNGDFLRFYDIKGNKVRNGFFVFDDNYKANDIIFQGDLNGQPDKNEKIIIQEGVVMEIFDDQGRRLMRDYPYSGNFNQEFNLSVGNLFGNPHKEIMISAQSDGKIMVFNYYGKIMQHGFYPYGRQSRDRFGVAIGNVDGGEQGESVLAFKNGNNAEVLIYDYRFSALKKKITVGSYSNDVRVACGDVDGNGIDEIVVGLNYGNKSTVKVFDFNGKKLSEFDIEHGFVGNVIDVGVLDVNYDGKSDIVVMSK
ncbi:MAG: putative glycoside hydrolase [bacterium]